MSTSRSKSARPSVRKEEQILPEQVLEEECLTGGSGRAAVPSESSVKPSPTPTCEPQEAVDAVSSASQQTNNLDPSDPRRPARKEPLFGIPRLSAAPLNVNPNYDDDYEKHLPPDPIYEEVSSPNARVYRVYMEESAKYDAYMTDEAREGLDVLLVFAGLFSAVLTTFVAQTSQSLQPDRATESTLLLREIAALQRAQMNGTFVDSIPSTPVDFTPAAIDIWVNGLWFTSLILSLASALFAVLIKQWIRHYNDMSFVSGTARERSLIRQYRFMGLQKWHVPALIGILPVLMHLSLAIFFVGLTLFLAPLRPSIAGIVGSLSTLIFVAYVATAVWPLFRPLSHSSQYHHP
ncbi:hypothetical protein BDZ89DRAFT_1080996 [Hymenopellis radicata]|nr:hypothetical protein BDZ89DRAFT_1080996 [Hymenopellis radicata]